MNYIKNNNSRIAWVDIVKGIGICLVVLGHVYRSNPVLTWICSFHMPLFFILSGWLRGSEKKQINWIVFIKKKVETLVIPFLIFLSIMYLYWIVVERHFRAFDIGPLWFLPVLFFAEVVSEIVLNVTNIKMTWGMILLSAFLLFICSLYVDSTTLLASIPRCLGALVFFLMGAVSADLVSIKNVKGQISSPILIGIAGVSAVLSIVVSQINGRVGLYSLNFGNIVLYFIAAIIGSVFVYSIAILIGKCKPFEFLGRYSIVILCTHEQVKRAFIQVCSIVTKTAAEEIRNNIFYGMCISVFVILLEVIVVFVVVKIGQIFKNTKLKWLFAFIK